MPLCPVCTAATAAAAEAASSSEPASKKRKLGHGHGYIAESDGDDEDYVPPWKDAPLLKPDITFFGQALDDAFDRCLLADREEVDLLIVVGTSLQVAPVSELLGHIPHRIPQVLINRDPVPHVMQHVDIALLGDCDRIVDWIERRMQKAPKHQEEVHQEPRLAFEEGMDNVWLFEGANDEHRWIQRMREVLAEPNCDSVQPAVDGTLSTGPTQPIAPESTLVEAHLKDEEPVTNVVAVARKQQSISDAGQA